MSNQNKKRRKKQITSTICDISAEHDRIFFLANDKEVQRLNKNELGEINKFTDTFIGAAPFIIIAAVELTKIPLALGFYRTKRLVWRLTFLITLFLLVFVTFETIFNGRKHRNERNVRRSKGIDFSTRIVMHLSC